jgi:hypothetical protein
MDHIAAALIEQTAWMEDTPMTEPASTPNSKPDTTRRWVRVVVIIAIIAVLLVAVMLLIGGGGGHGPGRHL